VTEKRNDARLLPFAFLSLGRPVSTLLRVPGAERTTIRRFGGSLGAGARHIADVVEVHQVKTPLLVEPEARSERELHERGFVSTFFRAAIEHPALIVGVQIPLGEAQDRRARLVSNTQEGPAGR
jgi:hypothetical protein